MSSTTIRYSGVPENSHSRGTDANLDSDTAAYTDSAPSVDTDLTARFRAAAYGGSGRTSAPSTPAGPASPHSEPDHLRHRPGDDWIIDHDRPYDIHDPGPFGSPGWFPDRRTGRHRRDELPDPIGQHEIDDDPDKAAWSEDAEALYERRTRSRDRRPPEPPDRPFRPSPTPRDEHRSRPDAGRGRHPATEPDAPHRFDKLREDAWTRFLHKSAPLAAAHRRPVPAPTSGRLARSLRRLAHRLRKTAPAEAVPTGGDHRLIPRQRRANRSGLTSGSSGARTDRALRAARLAKALGGAQRARADVSRERGGHRRSVADLPGGAAWA